MIAMHVRVDDRAVLQELAGMRRRVAGDRLETALVAGALVPMNAAKANAHVVTGTLRRSIHVGGYTELAPGFNPSEGYGDIGGNKHGDDEAVVYVGTNLAYARREEYGFIGVDSLGRRYNQAAHPYLRPAFDENGDAITAEVLAALDELVMGSR